MPRYEFDFPSGRRVEVEAPNMQAGLRGAKDLLARKDVARIPLDAPKLARPAEQQDTIGQRLLGGLETAGALVSGSTTGLLGGVAGLIPQTVREIAKGTFGSREGGERMRAATEKWMGIGSYEPRTEAGQRYTKALGEFSDRYLPPVAGLQTPGAYIPRQRAIALKGRAQALPAAVKTAVKEEFGPAANKGFVKAAGAAEIAKEEMRAQRAASFPSPYRLTKGERTRDFVLQRKESELSKQEIGAPLRERMVEHNERTLQNFDAYIEQTGASTTNLYQAGINVSDALKRQLKTARAKVSEAYGIARAKGETEQPVTLDRVIKHINESKPEALNARILGVAKQKLLQLGAAVEDEAGNLLAKKVKIDDAEEFRKSIVDSVDNKRPNIRQATRIKGAFDADTDSVGGAYYQAARRARVREARLFQNHSLVKDLLAVKKGAPETRQIALENVFNVGIVNASKDELSHLFRLLKRSEQGRQAVKDLQGTTLQWVHDRTFSNAPLNEAGQPIASAAKINEALVQLEKGGKLEVIFGKAGAEEFRKFAEQVRDLFTTVPGAVNTSQTAGVLLGYMQDYFPKISRALREGRRFKQGLEERQYIKEALK